MHAFHVPTWLYVTFVITVVLLALGIMEAARRGRPSTRWGDALRVLWVTLSGLAALAFAVMIWILRGLEYVP